MIFSFLFKTWSLLNSPPKQAEAETTTSQHPSRKGLKINERVLGSVSVFLRAILTLPCPQDCFQSSVFGCLRCQNLEGKSDKKKGSCLSQEDLGTRSGGTVVNTVQSPARSTRSICLTIFCYHSTASSPSVRAVPGNSWLP